MHVQATKGTEYKNNPVVRREALFGKDISTPFFQPKLTINTPGDAYEQEADQVADRVMGMQAEEAAQPQALALTPVAPVQRQCAECEKEELQRQEEEAEEKEVQLMPMASNADDTIQRQCAACEQEEAQRKESGSGDAGGKVAPGIVSEVLSSGGGQAMDGGTRQFMESRFGHDFGQVRIHTDSRAAESATAIQAKAYTSGSNIVFGQGQYQPESDSGKRLLAHELAHVGQQGKTGIARVQRQQVSGGTAVAPSSTYTTPQARGAGNGRRATIPINSTRQMEIIRYLCNCQLSNRTEQSLQGQVLPHPGFAYQFCRGRLTATAAGNIVPQSLTSGRANLGGGINIAPENGRPGLAANAELEASNTGSEPTVGGRTGVSIGDENTSVDFGANYSRGLQSGNNDLGAEAGLNIGGIRVGLNATDLLNPGRGFGVSIGPARRGPSRDTCRECDCPVVYTCFDNEPPQEHEVPVVTTVTDRTPLRYYFKVNSTADSPNRALRDQSREMLSEVKRMVDQGAQVSGITGYASPEFSSLSTAAGAQANCDLSIRRAVHLRNLLIRAGIDESNLPAEAEAGCELFGNRPSRSPDSQLSQAMVDAGFGPEDFDLFLFGDDIPDADLNEQFLGLLERIPDDAQKLQLFGIAEDTPAAADLLAAINNFVASRGQTGPVWRNILGYLRFATVTIVSTRQVHGTETRRTSGSLTELSNAACVPYARQAEQLGLFSTTARPPASEGECGREPVQEDRDMTSKCGAGR